MTIIIDFLKWAIENPKELTISGIGLFLLRHLAKMFVAKQARRVLNIGESELTWTRERVERITGEKWTGRTNKSWNRAVKNSRALSYLLQTEINPENPLRRVKDMQGINIVSLITALLGAAKLVLQAFDIQIPDQLINDTVNGAAAVVSIIGIFMTHRKTVERQHPFDVGISNPQSKNFGDHGPAV